MSQFIVSARKYRPLRFSDVVGQEHVSTTLKNALKNDHLAHAFLFCGPRGVGKTTCARILAKVLNCENLTEDHEPCNTCSSCEAFNKNASFNITELDAASNNSVEHIRALIEQVRFQPQQGKYKVFIIDEVHMLSQQAFNAFLKTLEEPPPYAIFILATTEKHKIIPTILSRCQIFDFRRISIPSMISHLENICQQEGITAEHDALHVIATKADGALRDALSIFDRIVSFSGKSISYQDVITNLNVLDHDYYFKIVDALLTSNVSELLLTFDEIVRKGFDPEVFTNGLAEHLRNILVCKDERTIQLLEAGEALSVKFKAQADLSPRSLLLTALDICNDCDVNYKQARNKRLHVEMALIRMCYIKQALEAGPQVQATAQPPQKKTADLSPKPSPEVPGAGKTPIIVPKKDPPKADNHVPSGNAKFIPTKFNSPKITMLSSLEKEVEKEEAENKSEVIIPTVESIRSAWDAYLEKVNSPSVQNALKNAVLDFEEPTVIVRVSSSISESNVRQENHLAQFLRDELSYPPLLMEIKVDQSLQPKEEKAKPKAPAFLGKKEKLAQMYEQNPLVKDLFRKLDLKYDE